MLGGRHDQVYAVAGLDEAGVGYNCKYCQRIGKSYQVACGMKVDVSEYVLRVSD